MAIQTADTREKGRVKLPVDSRPDRWWLEPVSTISILVVFIIYSSFRAFMGAHYETYFMPGIAPLYISPFYSPPIHEWVNFEWPISSALYILVFPLSFRMTCYYCRKAYYRAFFWDPPACAVAEPNARKNYTGEKKLPFSLLNLHRFALYAAFILVVFHWIHLAQAFFYQVNDANGNVQGGLHFQIAVGTLVIMFDTLMLSAYVFSCHSFRHLMGGALNFFSRSKGRYAMWNGISVLNQYHGVFFWLSLISVAIADFYVYMVSLGVITDFRFIG